MNAEMRNLYEVHAIDTAVQYCNVYWDVFQWSNSHFELCISNSETTNFNWANEGTTCIQENCLKGVYIIGE